MITSKVVIASSGLLLERFNDRKEAAAFACPRLEDTRTEAHRSTFRDIPDGPPVPGGRGRPWEVNHATEASTKVLICIMRVFARCDRLIVLSSGRHFIAPRYHKRDGCDHSEACEHSHGYGVLETSSSKKRKRFNEKHPETVGQDVPTNQPPRDIHIRHGVLEGKTHEDQTGGVRSAAIKEETIASVHTATELAPDTRINYATLLGGGGWSGVVSNAFFVAPHTHLR